MLKGKIKWYNYNKGYGFITNGSESSYFFHITNVHHEDREKVAKGASVLFSPSKNEKGDSAISIAINDDFVLRDSSELLENIKRWKLDAKLDELEKYFYQVEQEKEIESGEKYFVIGRKGTGKTALSEYICSKRDYNKFTEKMTFKNFPFNELYTLANNSYTRPNQYISLWKYLIYSTICQMMVKNDNINVEIRDILSQLFNIDSSVNSLKKNIKKWTASEISLNIGALSGKVVLDSSNRQGWKERLDVIEEVIQEYIDDSYYYIVFDELDEDYKSTTDPELKDNYLSLITSLFKAVQDIKSCMGNKINIRPIVFLRDDIYRLILDPDKNKWGDFLVELDWSAEELKRMLAFRISKAANLDKELLFDDAWLQIFSRYPVGVGTKARKKIPIFEYIGRSTQQRPRDYVRYLQACAAKTLELKQAIITPEVVKTVDKGFSNYLRSELVDEIHGVLPDINEIFAIISEIRKWVFSIDEFRKIYNSRLEQGILKTKDSEYTLKVLFDFSVIGNQARPGVHFFKYANKDARLNFKEKIVVHRGLFKALQII